MELTMCLSTNEKIKKMQYIHTMKYYWVINKNIISLATKHETEDHHVKQNKSDLESQVSQVFSNIWNLDIFKMHK
jgi:hypothetical protein